MEIGGWECTMFAARSGYELSMKAIGEAYKIGGEYKVLYVTKDEYAATLRVQRIV